MRTPQLRDRRSGRMGGCCEAQLIDVDVEVWRMLERARLSAPILANAAPEHSQPSPNRTQASSKPRQRQERSRDNLRGPMFAQVALERCSLHL